MAAKLSSSKMANRFFLLLNSLILKIPKQHFYCSFADVDSRAVLLAASWCYFFVNGLPLVFVELKNAIIKIEEAVNKNLTDYKKDIPNLFAFNQICVLSNGLKTRLGVFWHTQGSGKSFSMVFFARKCARKLKAILLSLLLQTAQILIHRFIKTLYAQKLSATKKNVSQKT